MAKKDLEGYNEFQTTLRQSLKLIQTRGPIKQSKLFSNIVTTVPNY